MDYHFKPIGIVRSCYPDKFGTPRQSGLVPPAHGFLEISSSLQPEFSLDGLNKFSHLWVIFIFHKNTENHFHSKVHPPRLGGKNIGVFATRSPHRPNPIGLSLVEIISVEKKGVWVSGVDLIDGTPILDIKPYLKDTEAKLEARSELVYENDCKPRVTWSVDALKFLMGQPQAPHLKELIEQTLKLDPRPLIYKGYEGVASPYREVHTVRFHDLDVHFRFISKELIQIEKVRGYF